MISGDVRQNDIGTRVRIDPIPNIEHEISSARVSVSHSQLTSMRRIEHSDQPGDYYEEPQISTVSTSEVVALQQGKESHLGMGVPAPIAQSSKHLGTGQLGIGALHQPEQQ